MSDATNASSTTAPADAIVADDAAAAAAAAQAAIDRRHQYLTTIMGRGDTPMADAIKLADEMAQWVSTGVAPTAQ